MVYLVVKTFRNGKRHLELWKASWDLQSLTANFDQLHVVSVARDKLSGDYPTIDGSESFDKEFDMRLASFFIFGQFFWFIAARFDMKDPNSDSQSYPVAFADDDDDHESQLASNRSIVDTPQSLFPTAGDGH